MLNFTVFRKLPVAQRLQIDVSCSSKRLICTTMMMSSMTIKRIWKMRSQHLQILCTDNKKIVWLKNLKNLAEALTKKRKVSRNCKILNQNSRRRVQLNRLWQSKSSNRVIQKNFSMNGLAKAKPVEVQVAVRRVFQRVQPIKTRQLLKNPLLQQKCQGLLTQELPPRVLKTV
jgi:hypothetical protein